MTACCSSRAYLKWRFSDRYGVKGLERWELGANCEAAAAANRNPARTVVRMVSDYKMPGLLGRAMDWLVTRHAVARRNENYLARLKRYAEHEPE